MTPERHAQILSEAKLTRGQGREHPVCNTRSSSWYDEDGVWMCYGDLSRDDLINIAHALRYGEKFIVIPAYAGFHAFQKAEPVMQKGVRLSEDAPGCKYVAKHAVFILIRGHIVRVDNLLPAFPSSPDRRDNLIFETIDPDAAVRLICEPHVTFDDLAAA